MNSESTGSGRRGAGDPEACFHEPASEARPRAYWYWMNANATQAGITRDLEDMAAVGIGGVYLMTIGSADERTLVDPPAVQLTEHWWDLIRHAAREGERLGIEVAMNACDGWALAGGPWITPELSMQKVVHSEVFVEPGASFDGPLPRPPAQVKERLDTGPTHVEAFETDYYRDLAVFAVPAADAGAAKDSANTPPRVTTSMEGVDASGLPGGGEIVSLRPGWIQYEFDEPFTARSLALFPGPVSLQLHRMRVEVSDDGHTFRSLGRLECPRHGWHERYTRWPASHSLTPVTARFFRFVIDPEDTPPAAEDLEGAKPRNRDAIPASQILLSGAPRIEGFEGKTGLVWRRGRLADAETIPAEDCVDPAAMIDLTDALGPDGELRWTPPDGGRWRILRFGATTTGASNVVSGTATGLESDKLSAEAARVQFEGWFGEAMRRMGPDPAQHTLRVNHTDSWECGGQSWSPGFREGFRARRGYDPLPWLPVFAGIPVASAERSERFLHDVRQTLDDMIVEEYYETMVGLTHAAGARFSMESIAPVMPSDGMRLYGRGDIPMGEFWLASPDHDKPNDVRDAVSAAHIYGKPVVQAEAFTQISANFDETPGLLARLGDHNLAVGVNRFAFHVWAQQAFPERPGPGVTLKGIGVPFGGTQTWHRPAEAWFRSIPRKQALLQWGLPVIDFCVFNGEEIPSRAYPPQDLPVAIPAGFAWDTLNREVLLGDARVEAGRLKLGSGMEYRFLVLGDSRRMSLPVAKRIGQFAEAGLPVIGDAPTATPGLEGFPESERHLEAIVRETWKRVLPLNRLSEAIEEAGLAPDLDLPGVDPQPVFREPEQYASPSVSWNHRAGDSADAYFLSNQERRGRSIEAGFRVAGKVPEIWDPEDGAIREAPVWREEDGGTVVALDFEPVQSLFVVFRKEVGRKPRVTRFEPTETHPPETGSPPDSEDAPPAWIADGRLWTTRRGAWRVGTADGTARTVAIDAVPPAQALDGSWTVAFDPPRRTPESLALESLGSLHEHADFDVRHYSGTMNYRTEFAFRPETPDKPVERRYLLDLGGVADLATVVLNGRTVRTLWRPPFRVDVTEFLETGNNRLEIAVTNAWRNRLIGDAGLPEEERVTWTLFPIHETIGQDAPLRPSGLLGPVRILPAEGRGVGPDAGQGPC